MPEAEFVSPLFPILQRLHGNFHSARQAIERELAPLKAQAANAAQLSDNEISKLVVKISKLQLEIEQYKQTHLALTETFDVRLDAGFSLCVDADEEKLQSTLLVLCATHLAERGHSAALNRLLELNPELTELIDLQEIEEENQLVAEVVNNQLKGALHWCHEHRSALRKCDPTLQLELQKQEFLNLSASNVHLALEYAIKTFRRADSTHHTIISGILTSLYMPTADLDQRMTPENLAKLSERLRQAIRLVYRRPTFSLLTTHLKLGMSTVKLRRCRSSWDHKKLSLEEPDAKLHQELAKFADRECPACNPSYYSLAKGVPVAHHSYSKLGSDLYVYPQTSTLVPAQVIERMCAAKGEEVDWSRYRKAYAL